MPTSYTLTSARIGFAVPEKILSLELAGTALASRLFGKNLGRIPSVLRVGTTDLPFTDSPSSHF